MYDINKKSMEWIPTKVALPPLEQDDKLKRSIEVLICNINRNIKDIRPIEIAHLSYENFKWYILKDPIGYNFTDFEEITHWQYLPELPLKQEEELLIDEPNLYQFYSPFEFLLNNN